MSNFMVASVALNAVFCGTALAFIAKFKSQLDEVNRKEKVLDQIFNKTKGYIEKVNREQEDIQTDIGRLERRIKKVEVGK